MSTISADLADLLRTIDYPAHQTDLVREARKEGISRAEVSRLAGMTPRSYSGRFDVMSELRWNRALFSRTSSLQPLAV